MQETWKRFVYPLIEDKKNDVEEETYHRHIENQLMLLGWEPWKGEIIHKQSLRIGNRNRMEPDILIARDNEYQFVIEVKRPGNTSYFCRNYVHKNAAWICCLTTWNIYT